MPGSGTRAPAPERAVTLGRRDAPRARAQLDDGLYKDFTQDQSFKNPGEAGYRPKPPPATASAAPPAGLARAGRSRPTRLLVRGPAGRGRARCPAGACLVRLEWHRSSRTSHEQRAPGGLAMLRSV